ncbi:type II secretion system minor pseudopilin GspK [Acidovorax sp. Be4]|uniref:Type II secretion system protein K n=1 Tax=Acidovorax bellezanensis TaxID=2976702 RepID=A0ABT2PRY6_9BURK|nr:type II secretion system minor pseudopilin GspK [Acidovorax sp. Be4]MCT9813239.1 type II secretion system minor pseudopilin GspK [Acidovorax sp. Be4]
MKQPARAHTARRLAPPGLARLRARGAALLAAMLTVTLVATFAATALWQQWRSVEVETAERARAQAAWILLGALDWSRVVLREDARSGGPDHLAEPWAVPLQEARLSSFLAAEGNVSQVDDASSETANAFLSGEIIDLQSRMNLRNLLDREDANLPFERLFERLGLPSGTLQQIAMGLRQAQAAGSNEQSTAPLMPRTLVQLGWLGIAPQVIARLEPHVTLLPMRTPINVNTASAEVIWASVDGLDWAKASQFVQSREASPLRNTADALTRMGVASDTPSNNLAVSSSFFEIRGRLRLGDALVSERSLVQRKNMDVVTLWRERGSWTSPSLPLPGQSPAP